MPLDCGLAHLQSEDEGRAEDAALADAALSERLYTLSAQPPYRPAMLPTGPLMTPLSTVPSVAPEQPVDRRSPASKRDFPASDAAEVKRIKMEPI